MRGGKKKKKKRSRQQRPAEVAEAGGQSAVGIEEWKGRKFKMSNLAKLAGRHSANRQPPTANVGTLAY
ncbi:hypothetical protein E5D57_009002 [Metarhizium anisopliae]|nr:hypothetical protein E5D57_009002 [Metarhizium anisopliae]